MNIENFPTSEAAKRMMGYITGNGFYDRSYVGKWIFQVMGIEMDEARRIIEDELPYQNRMLSGSTKTDDLYIRIISGTKCSIQLYSKNNKKVKASRNHKSL